MEFNWKHFNPACWLPRTSSAEAFYMVCELISSEYHWPWNREEKTQPHQKPKTITFIQMLEKTNQSFLDAVVSVWTRDTYQAL